MRGRKLIATDLDGTLVGDARALARFSDWLDARRGAVTLVYATGRTATEVRRAMTEGGLPFADYVIGSVGTELAEGATGNRDEAWETCAGRSYDAEAVRRVAARIPGLTLQPDECQSDLKASFYLYDPTGRQRAEFADALTSAGVVSEFTYSGARYLDVLPAGMNKGAALLYLADRLGLHRSQVVVCGDSGNDLPMYRQGFYGVVVANAEAELAQGAGAPVYHSPFAYADGVIDGIRHWSVNDRAPSELRGS